MPDARDLRSNELEGRLRQLHPADELGYPFLYRDKENFCSPNLTAISIACKWTNLWI
jgi:hypothetical protein